MELLIPKRMSNIKHTFHINNDRRMIIINTKRMINITHTFWNYNSITKH